MPFSVPILFLTYNRPTHTQKVFEVIRQMQPAQLFWAIDGAKNEQDLPKIAAVKAIIQQITWQCDLKILENSQNLGCGIAVSRAISWFFEHVEQGIILEDDCLPEPSFFHYCQILLERYAQNNEIMCISGVNYCPRTRKIPESYFYSYYAQIWGWATWKRAWLHYQHSTQSWEAFIRSSIFKEIFTTQRERVYWQKTLINYAQQNPNLWALRWLVSIWQRKGLAVIPKHNLVSNIGFGQEATHTRITESWFANMPTFPLNQITFPQKISRNLQADICTFRTFYNPKTTFLNHLRNLSYWIFPYTWRKWLKSNLIKTIKTMKNAG
ncbi:MAG: nucleotide-diphospho-sugar transferase [Microscillaceae bacterium]|nr:nucleotide-diphospho-sugar transferase [Microscillaceae bacterium]MDW8460476.1 nucleotide-diphospho-sugar transferase [Cytophagales bacterium]